MGWIKFNQDDHFVLPEFDGFYVCKDDHGRIFVAYIGKNKIVISEKDKRHTPEYFFDPTEGNYPNDICGMTIKIETKSKI